MTSDTSASRAAYREIAESVARMGGGSVSQLGLRFDRVVIRVLDELSLSSSSAVPEGSSVLFTIAAPIRAPKKMVDALQVEIVELLLRSGDGSEWNGVLHGNGATLRRVGRPGKGRPALLGFVHNPDVETAQVLDLAEAWLRSSG